MKITDPDVIQTGEKDLIDAVKEDLDWDAVKEIIKEKMSATALVSKGGQIVVHNNEIAFRIDFDISLSGSLMFDRDGNHISENEALDDDSISPETPDEEQEARDLSLDDGDLEEIGDIEDVEPEEEVDEIQADAGDDLPGDDWEEDVELEEDVEPEEDVESGEEPELEEENIEDDVADDIIDDDLLDDDINDILQESREFWEQKKDE